MKRSYRRFRIQKGLKKVTDPKEKHQMKKKTTPEAERQRMEREWARDYAERTSKTKKPGERAAPDPTKSLLTPSGFKKEDLEAKNPNSTLVARGIAPLTRMRPHIGRLMADAYTIIDQEFRMLREKVEEGQQLNSVEAGKFARYVDSMAKLAKEERIQQSQDNLEGKTTQELAQLAREALQALPTGEDAEE